MFNRAVQRMKDSVDFKVYEVVILSYGVQACVRVRSTLTFTLLSPLCTSEKPFRRD